MSFMLAAVLLSLLPRASAHAQSAVITWSDPVKLSSDVEVSFASVAADQYGGVHVFWAQGVGPDAVADMILATHWDGSSWSTPNDIFVAPFGSGLTYDMPRAVAAKNGKIYLVWASGGMVYFSSAPASMTTDAREWTAPVSVVGLTVAHMPQIAVDQQGTIHVIVTDRKTGGSLLHTRSTDEGTTWSEPIAVSLPEWSGEQTPDHPQLIVDQENTIHVFWAASYPPAYVGREILYAQSSDGGVTWSLPNPLSHTESREDWDARPAVTIDSSDRLHLTWVCVLANRCYRWSQDHGATWSEVQMLFAPLLGSAGFDAVAADDQDTVYWVGALRYPQAVYATYLSETRWQEPPAPIIAETEWGELGSAHRPQAVVGLGNQLHVVMVEGDAGPVWYMSGVTAAPAVAPLPLPLPAPGNDSEHQTDFIMQVALATATPVVDSKVEHVSTPLHQTVSFPKAQAADAPMDPTVASVASVVFTLAAVFTLVLRRKHR